MGSTSMDRQTDCPAPGCAYQGDLLIGRVGSTGPSSPSKRAGRQDKAWGGRVGQGTCQPLTTQPVQPEMAQGEGEALTTPGKAGGTWARGSAGT